MGQGGWAAATLLKRGTEELSKPWQTLGNEGKFESEGEQEGDVTLWENIWPKEGGEDRTFFFCFLSLPAWDFEVDRRQERKRCLPTACHASAGTPLQAKTKRVRLTMFMFSLLAKVDFNRNTVSTINTPPPLCPIPYSCSAPLYRPVQTRGIFRTTAVTFAALLLRKHLRGTNEQTDDRPDSVSLC